MTDLATRTTVALLDIYTDDGLADDFVSHDALATISAGTKGEKGYPVISRDGTIYLHDHGDPSRCEGLRAALEATGYKSLTITFPFNEQHLVFSQTFRRYNSGALEAWGDAQRLVVFRRSPLNQWREPQGQYYVSTVKDKSFATDRFEFPAGTPEYVQEKKDCKVATNVYFALATWQGQGAEGGALAPDVLLPDGLGLYRLRFTSRISARNFAGAWRTITKLTGGPVAGIPIDLRITYREASDPSGSRRNVPVFTFTVKPPGGLALTSSNFQRMLGSGIEAGRQLMLDPPVPESLEMAALDAWVDEEAKVVDAESRPALSAPAPVAADASAEVGERLERDLKRLNTGVNPDEFTARWFAIAKGTPFAEPEGYREWLAQHTDGITSLSEWANGATPEEADKLLFALQRAIDDAARQAEHDARNADVTRYPEGVTEQHLEFLNKQLKRAQIAEGDRHAFISWLLHGNINTIASNGHLTLETFEGLKGKLGTINGKGWRPLSDGQLFDLVAGFEAYSSSDAAAEEVLG